MILSLNRFLKCEDLEFEQHDLQIFAHVIITFSKVLSLSDTGEVGDPGDALNAPLWFKDLEPTGVSLQEIHSQGLMIQSGGGKQKQDHMVIVW